MTGPNTQIDFLPKISLAFALGGFKPWEPGIKIEITSKAVWHNIQPNFTDNLQSAFLVRHPAVVGGRALLLSTGWASPLSSLSCPCCTGAMVRGDVERKKTASSDSEAITLRSYIRVRIYVHMWAWIIPTVQSLTDSLPGTLSNSGRGPRVLNTVSISTVLPRLLFTKSCASGQRSCRKECNKQTASHNNHMASYVGIKYLLTDFLVQCLTVPWVLLQKPVVTKFSIMDFYLEPT